MKSIFEEEQKRQEEMERTSAHLDAINRKGERQDAFWSGFGLATTITIVIVMGVVNSGLMFFPALASIIFLFYIIIKLSNYFPLNFAIPAVFALAYGIFITYEYITIPGFSILELF
jgi:hypothetical protein